MINAVILPPIYADDCFSGPPACTMQQWLVLLQPTGLPVGGRLINRSKGQNLLLDNDELIDLLARCALRDQKALEQLYKKTAAYLNGVALRIVGTPDSSNEVLQEAFVQIWDNAATFAPAKANPLTWMCSIVRYRAIDKLRQEKRHRNRPPADEEIDILLNTPGGEQQEAAQQRFRLNEYIQQCLEGMNDNFKQSVELAYLHGYSREELAETLGANVNTVKSWLRRGAANLKSCLEAQLGEPAHD